MKLINFSNHPSANWSKAQYDTAKEMLHGGEILDIPFPNVSPNMSENEIRILAQTYISKIMSENPSIVMCQGEFNLSYQVITELKTREIKVVAACSERDTVEMTLPDGSHKKEAIFKFVRFREY